ncbi:MAG: hypothetical protein ABIH66_13265 [bacterium]
MKISKSELKVIYIAIRILEGVLPYEDEVDEIMDLCRTLLEPEEVMELDQKVHKIISESSILKPLSESF